MAGGELHDNRIRMDWTLLGGIGLIVLGYIMLHDVLGGTLLEHSPWDSYTLQALAWQDGRLDLGQNYTWLELAIYQGQYYVSFPPIPSVILFPFALVAGEETPNNFVIMLLAVISVVLCYLCFKKTGSAPTHAMFFAVFFVLGSNMLWMSTMGAVWFMAQAANMVFCFGAVLCLLCNKKGACLTLIALAIGCRPFSIFFFIAVFACFCVWESHLNPKNKAEAVGRQFKYLIGPAAIAAFYLWYNYARFGEPLEFGHNYLPEFTGEGNAQFSFEYIPRNIINYFFRTVTMLPDGTLSFPAYDGFMFALANPIFILWIVYFGLDIAKKRMSVSKLIVTAGFLLNLLALLMHKTLGGWQFGARYTVDLLPYVLMYFMLTGNMKVNKPIAFLGIFAVMFNLYGTLIMEFKDGYKL